MQCSKLAMLGTIGQQKVYERGTFSVKMVYKKARLDFGAEPSLKNFVEVRQSPEGKIPVDHFQTPECCGSLFSVTKLHKHQRHPTTVSF